MLIKGNALFVSESHLTKSWGVGECPVFKGLTCKWLELFSFNFRNLLQALGKGRREQDTEPF